MRIHFDQLTLPKKAAKRVHHHFSSNGDDSAIFPSIKLSQAQELTAQMLGYETWHELVTTTNSGDFPGSPLDEECSEGEQIERLDYQNKRLGFHSPIVDDVRRRIVQKVRVSARNPNSSQLAETSRTVNRIVKSKNYGAQPNEWRFFPSERSEETYEMVCDVADSLAEGRLSFYDANIHYQALLESQPEDMYVLEEILFSALHYEDFTFIDQQLDRYERVILRSLPTDLPKEGDLLFHWGCIANRTLLRSVMRLAEIYYRLEHYAKAKEWFEFAYRAYEVERHRIQTFLNDLQNQRPLGRQS